MIPLSAITASISSSPTTVKVAVMVINMYVSLVTESVSSSNNRKPARRVLDNQRSEIQRQTLLLFPT